MAKDDYATAGGALKLKGAKIEKKKKKDKKKSKSSHVESNTNQGQASGNDTKGITELADSNAKKVDEEPIALALKTETERKHEEMRRKRLDERLKREGFKTHKERVEELNKYLSNLSEHHDMPRIGPG